MWFLATVHASASVTVTVSGLAQSNTGPFTAGDPVSVTFTIDSGTAASWNAGTQFTPSQWSNDYPDDSVVITSLSSSSILGGAVAANSTAMPFANFQIWDESPDRFTIGATIAFGEADLGNTWYMTGANFETTSLPLNYVGSYTDPVHWLSGAAGTYTSGLAGSFFYVGVSNGFQNTLFVSVDEVVVVPEPAFAIAVAGLCALGMMAWRRRKRSWY